MSQKYSFAPDLWWSELDHSSCTAIHFGDYVCEQHCMKLSLWSVNLLLSNGEQQAPFLPGYKSQEIKRNQ